MARSIRVATTATVTRVVPLVVLGIALAGMALNGCVKKTHMVDDGAAYDAAGAGTSTFQIPIVSTGPIDQQVDGRQLDFSNTGTFIGPLNMGTGATLRITGGSYTIADGVVITGEGFAMVGGTLTIEGTVTADRIAFSGGTISSAGTIQIAPTGAFVWTNRPLEGSGTLNIPVGATLTLSSGSTKTLSGWTINNAGTTTWTSGRISAGNGAVFNNLAGALFDIRSANTFAQDFGAPW